MGTDSLTIKLFLSRLPIQPVSDRNSPAIIFCFSHKMSSRLILITGANRGRFAMDMILILYV